MATGLARVQKLPPVVNCVEIGLGKLLCEIRHYHLEALGWFHNSCRLGCYSSVSIREGDRSARLGGLRIFGLHAALVKPLGDGAVGGMLVVRPLGPGTGVGLTPPPLFDPLNPLLWCHKVKNRYKLGWPVWLTSERSAVTPRLLQQAQALPPKRRDRLLTKDSIPFSLFSRCRTH